MDVEDVPENVEEIEATKLNSRNETGGPTNIHVGGRAGEAAEKEEHVNEREIASDIEDFREKQSAVLLNVGVVAALLAAFGFDAFESQAQISTSTTSGEVEDWTIHLFAIVCIITMALNIGAIVLAVFFYEVLNNLRREHVHEWLHMCRYVINIPLLCTVFGLVFLSMAIVIQSHIDYDLHQGGIPIFAVMFGVIILTISWTLQRTRKMRRSRAKPVHKKSEVVPE